jgi:hypothetical protein
MNITRHISRIALCLLAGVIISYGVAWWFEYERTSRLLPFLPFATGPGVRQEASSAWPISKAQWPKDITPPTLRPDDVRLAIESSGTDFWTFFGPSDAGWYEVDEVASGWPRRCTSRFSLKYFEGPSIDLSWPMPDTRVWYGGWHAFDIARPTNQAVLGPLEVRLPIRPLWSGLAVNTVFYGCLIAAIAWLAGWAVRANRRRRGLCEVCKYPRGVSPVCTECGKPKDLA